MDGPSQFKSQVITFVQMMQSEFEHGIHQKSVKGCMTRLSILKCRYITLTRLSLQT